MKVIKQEVLDCTSNMIPKLYGFYDGFSKDDQFRRNMQLIETYGRICYRTGDRQTDDSYIKFLDARKSTTPAHTSFFEHVPFYLNVENGTRSIVTNYDLYDKCFELFVNGRECHSKFNLFNDTLCISTNYRVLYENDFTDDEIIQILTPFNPTLHEARATWHIMASRVIENELERHRVASYTQESTRYCNYSLSKFDDGQIKFIATESHDGNELFGEWHLGELESDQRYKNLSQKGKIYIDNWCRCEDNYNTLVALGEKPEDARRTLSLDLASELYMSMWKSDFMGNFCTLRLDGHAHHEVRELANQMGMLAIGLGNKNCYTYEYDNRTEDEGC